MVIKKPKKKINPVLTKYPIIDQSITRLDIDDDLSI